MATLSPEVSARARKTQSVVLRRLAAVGQEPVARAVGVDTATVSRFQSDHLAKVAGILAALGLKVVPEEMRCYARDELEAMLLLAQRRLARMSLSDLEVDAEPGAEPE